MPIQNAEDLFLTLLTHLHSVETRFSQAVQELSGMAEDPDVKQLLETRVYLSKQDISNIEESFRKLGKQPMKPPVSALRFADVWLEDVRREANEIQGRGLKAMYVLGAIREIVDFHIGEYKTCIAIAGLSGYIGVMTLLERNLGDKLMFVNRTEELLRAIGRTAIAEKARRAA